MELAQAFAVKANLTNLRPLAEGLEFNVYRATSSVHGSVVLRVPKFRVFQNANDPNTDARDLICQEAAILNLLRHTPVPVPQVHGCYEIDGYPAMVCEYMPADDDDEDDAGDHDVALGRVGALIHTTPVPTDWDVQLVAMEGRDARTQLATLFPQRMRRRLAVLARLEPQTQPWAVAEATLQAVAAPLFARLAPALLHMDLRRVNVRMRRRSDVSAVFDWTNALLAPPVVDVYRSLEWGAQGAAFLAGYESVRCLEEVSAREEAFLRLDAALVLALVFVSEAPDAERREGALRRVRELCEELNG